MKSFTLEVIRSITPSGRAHTLKISSGTVFLEDGGRSVNVPGAEFDIPNGHKAYAYVDLATASVKCDTFAPNETDRHIGFPFRGVLPVAVYDSVGEGQLSVLGGQVDGTRAV